MGGRVRKELVLDYAELLDRPMIEVDATIACVSNEVGGDLIGNARWLGCRLDDLLEEAGIEPVPTRSWDVPWTASPQASRPLSWTGATRSSRSA